MKPRLIIEMAGGLGNQMFQYAFFLQMQHLGYPCKLYYDAAQHIHNGTEIDKVFGVPLPFASKDALDALLYGRKDLLSRIMRRVKGTSSRYWEHDKGYDFKPEIFLQRGPVYLQGCWLSPFYFKDVEKEVKDAFRFPDITDTANREVLDKIAISECSVAIHARFGDYLSSDVHLTLDYNGYIEKAIHRLPFTVSCDYFVFSDDLQKAGSVLGSLKRGENRVHFVSGNDGAESWKDMALMSRCHHQIIANSTFSWWGAWLNTFKNKMVIGPKDWFTVNEWNKNSIIPASWIAI